MSDDNEDNVSTIDKDEDTDNRNRALLGAIVAYGIGWVCLIIGTYIPFASGGPQDASWADVYGGVWIHWLVPPIAIAMIFWYSYTPYVWKFRVVWWATIVLIVTTSLLYICWLFIPGQMLMYTISSLAGEIPAQTQYTVGQLAFYDQLAANMEFSTSPGVIFFTAFAIAFIGLSRFKSVHNELLDLTDAEEERLERELTAEALAKAMKKTGEGG